MAKPSRAIDRQKALHVYIAIGYIIIFNFWIYLVIRKKLMSIYGLTAIAALCVLASGVAVAADTQAEDMQAKVVYHLNAGLEQASNGLRNIGNHLDANPDAKIVVVAHSSGIDFLLKKNKDKFKPIVDRLNMMGVDFRVCENTMHSRNLSEDDFIDDTTFVPSGVAEVARL